MKVSKIKILLAILFFSLSFLFLLSILNQSLSVDFMNLLVEATAVLLWVIIPIIFTILSLLVGWYKEKFTFLIETIITLVLISNMTFIVYLNCAQTDLGVIFIALSVWGSTILFVLPCLIGLLYTYFFQKSIKELMGDRINIKIIKSFFLSATVTFLLLQLFLMGSSMVAYKVVEASNIKEKSDYTLFSFYKPFVYEIRLKDGQRWSYGRFKFVNNGE